MKENKLSDKEIKNFDKKGYLVGCCKSCGKMFLIPKLGYKYGNLNQYECAHCVKKRRNINGK